MQDIAGVRFEAEMTLTQQDEVARTIVRIFQQTRNDTIHDLRRAPRSGYRAVHVWLRLPERVEVQIRTRVQGAWANAYEELGDIFGRGIRYGELPAAKSHRDMVLAFQSLSVDELSWFEERRDVFEQKRRLERYSGLSRDPARDRALEQTWREIRETEHNLLDQLEGLKRSLGTLRREAEGGGYEGFSH